MQIIIKIAVSLCLIMGAFWAFIPGGFGVHNFAKSHNHLLGLIARICWIALIAAHFLLMYLLWFSNMSYWWLLLLVGAHFIFLVLFGRDLGTN